VATAITVDASGNAYVAGNNANSQFPSQAFAAKLDPTGDLVFLAPVGSANSQARAIALTASGQILISGLAGAGFPATAGAYSIPNPANRSFLTELDSTGATTIFSATGIGGSAIALDAAGNIFVAGTTAQLDYPTTPGVYQTEFPAFSFCGTSFCSFVEQGPNQYVTKLDPTGSHLFYSTALSGTAGTQNVGLAVDPTGNAYVTGYAAPGYPYTVTAPSLGPLPSSGVLNTRGLPFVSKLDPSGQNLLFSVPVGGSGVQVDSAGNVDVAGGYGASPIQGYSMTVSLPALANIPSGCLPDQLLSIDAAYVAQLHGTQGALLNTQFIGGDSLRIAAVALSGSNLWIAGATDNQNVPFTPGASTLYFPNVFPAAGAGAYLGAVDFSQSQPPGAPHIDCIIDAADGADVGPVAPLQLLTILGSNLGPDTGVAAPDYADTNVAGVQVSIENTPAQLLYASSTQINLAVPAPQKIAGNLSPIQITFNGATSTARAIPISYSFVAPQIFLNSALTFPLASPPVFAALALNPDGTVNSPSNPASSGSSISVFVNGLIPNPNVTTAPLHLSADGGWTVESFDKAGPFVTQVRLQAPSAYTTGFGCPEGSNKVCWVDFTLYESPGGPAVAPSPGIQAAVYLTR